MLCVLCVVRVVCDVPWVLCVLCVVRVGCYVPWVECVLGVVGLTKLTVRVRVRVFY